MKCGNKIREMGTKLRRQYWKTDRIRHGMEEDGLGAAGEVKWTGVQQVNIDENTRI